MKRMVLIPEEKLLRYEEQLNDQPPTNEQAGGSTFSWGFRPPIHYPGGNYPGHDYLYTAICIQAQTANVLTSCLRFRT